MSFLFGLDSIAWNATHTFSDKIREQVTSQALEIFLKKSRWVDPGKGSVLSLLKLIYKRAALDGLRRAKATHHRSPSRGSEQEKIPWASGSASLPVSIDQIQEDEVFLPDKSRIASADTSLNGAEPARLFEDISDLFELLSQPSSGKKGVDYSEVFILSTLVRVVERLFKSGVSRREAFSTVEELIRLPAGFGDSPLTRGCPATSRIWEALKEAQAPLGVELICQVIEDLSEASGRFSTGKWYQWVKRAKEKARQEISSELWEECFAPLHPDHRKSFESKRAPERRRMS